MGSDDPLLAIRVDCYAGHRGEQTPLAMTIAGRRVAVTRVLDQWLAPDYRYFKVSGEHGDTYLIRHDVRSGEWELTMFRRGE